MPTRLIDESSAGRKKSGNQWEFGKKEKVGTSHK